MSTGESSNPSNSSVEQPPMTTEVFNALEPAEQDAIKASLTEDEYDQLENAVTGGGTEEPVETPVDEAPPVDEEQSVNEQAPEALTEEAQDLLAEIDQNNGEDTPVQMAQLEEYGVERVDMMPHIADQGVSPDVIANVADAAEVDPMVMMTHFAEQGMPPESLANMADATNMDPISWN